MNDINKPTNSENFGGLNKLWFAPSTWISAISCKLNGVTQSVTFITGKDWLLCYCTAETIKFTQEKISDDKGEYFRTKLTGFIPKDTPEILAILSEMDQYKYICVYQDNNGNYKLLGNLDEPLNFSESLEIPETVAGSNGRTIAFERDIRVRSSFIVNPL